MSVEKIQRDLTNLFNYPSDPNPTTQADYINAVKNWVGNVINLVDISLWQPETAYEVGAIVRTPSLPVFALKCITAGTSDVTEPDYTDVSEGDTIQDNDIEWIICTINTENSDSKANVNASNIGVNADIDNSELWGGAIGGGEIAEDDGKLVTGGTVYAVTNGLASDIADNTDDIATNTENIAQNATDIDIADKRITNIEKLLQGNLYDYQTDSSSAYTKSVPSGAMPYAGLEQIGGKTIVFNQLSQIPQNATYTKTLGAYNYYEIENVSVTPIVGHKVYFRCVNDSSASNFLVHFIVNGSEITTGNNDFIKTITDTITFRVRMYNKSAEEDTGTISNLNVRIQDLTLLYGAGNEPSTVDEFKEWFPADWYAFNEGTLLSAGVTEVVSKDGNNATLQTYSIPASIQALEGYGWSAGTAYNYVDFERKVFVQNVGSRAYASGDESDSTVVTDMTTTYYPLPTAVETDISEYLTDDNLINVESGGTLTFENQHGDDYRLPVPSDVTYMIDLQAAINDEEEEP